MEQGRWGGALVDADEAKVEEQRVDRSGADPIG